MNHLYAKLALSTLLLAAASCMAQQGPMPPRLDVAAVTGADAKTAQAAEKLLRDQHDKIEAIRADTDTQLAKLLTPAQLDKLHEAMRKNRPEGRSDGPPGGKPQK
jgi:Spy/CpxP family protein refolding chaperone